MNIPAFELAHAMWFLGNRICFQCRSSKESGNTDKLQFCPIAADCSGGIETSSYQSKGKWIFSEDKTESTDSKQLVLFD